MKRLRLLLCDDDSQMLSFLQSVLKPEYTVIGTAEDGQALIAAAQALRPDLVLTDIHMPKLDGIDAVHELRRTLPDCQVIFHTSRTDPEVMAAAFSAARSDIWSRGPCSRCSPAFAPRFNTHRPTTKSSPSDEALISCHRDGAVRRARRPRRTVSVRRRRRATENEVGDLFQQPD